MIKRDFLNKDVAVAALRELSHEEVLLVSGGLTQGGAQASGVEVPADAAQEAAVAQGPKGAQASGVEVAA